MSCQLLVLEALAILSTALPPVSSQPAQESITRPPAASSATDYRFTPADEALLDEIERACFLYFWNEVGSPAPLAKDRFRGPVSSIAAVGFQLSSLPIGVERRWITREQGAERAAAVLRALIERSDNKKWGVYLHYPDLNTGGMSREGYEIVASTVDHALLIAGAIPAAEYFGEPVRGAVDRLIAETNWRAYAVGPQDFLSMGWRPDDPDALEGPGQFIEWHWYNASDEERLIYFLAAGAPNPEFAVPPQQYYRLTRPIERHDGMPPYVVSWPGSLFTYLFSHCWIDYAALGADDPGAFGIDAPRVDWFENSRRAVLTHCQRCIEQSGRFKTLSAERWGLSACAARDGYIVPEIQPNLRDVDEWFDGTIAPYAAGTAIMVTPRESVTALRAFRELKDARGRPLVWRDPAEGGYGLVDSFNLDQGFASDDYVGIDHGPMLVAIENARTGLIHKLFMRHGAVQRSLKRLQLSAGK
ncbi:MAG: hypothetical protein HRF50_09325 [Phycisphaerae bacterium]|jgi:hypothetical protein